MAVTENKELSNIDIAILALITSGDENAAAQTEFMSSLLMKAVGMKDREKILTALERSRERLVFLTGKIDELKKIFRDQKEGAKAR